MPTNQTTEMKLETRTVIIDRIRLSGKYLEVWLIGENTKHDRPYDFSCKNGDFLDKIPDEMYGAFLTRGAHNLTVDIEYNIPNWNLVKIVGWVDTPDDIAIDYEFVEWWFKRRVRLGLSWTTPDTPEGRVAARIEKFTAQCAWEAAIAWFRKKVGA